MGGGGRSEALVRGMVGELKEEGEWRKERGRGEEMVEEE